MKKYLFFVFSIILSHFVKIEAKTYIIVDEELKYCKDTDEDYAVYDYSNFKIIPINDTHTFFNGSLKFLREMKSPWHLRLHTEQYVRGHWLPTGYHQDIRDHCKEIHNSMRPWYYATKNLKGCPIPKNHEWNFDMISIELPDALLTVIPNHYIGRWRLVMETLFDLNGVEKRDCVLGFGDLYRE